MKGDKVVYGWFADSIPFYIGIGSLNRSKSRSRRNGHCSNKRAKAERENSFEVRILHKNLSWKEACEIEIALISLYGRVDNKTGILTNKTDGGEGYCNPSKEVRNKISKAHKGKIVSKETRRRMSKSQLGNENNLGRKHSEETKRKISESEKGKVVSEETKKLLRENCPTKRKIMTPYGLFDSVREASRAIDIHSGSLSRLCKNPRKSGYYYVN